jgi:hypothetical protein
MRVWIHHRPGWMGIQSGRSLRRSKVERDEGGEETWLSIAPGVQDLHPPIHNTPVQSSKTCPTRAKLLHHLNSRDA